MEARAFAELLERVVRRHQNRGIEKETVVEELTSLAEELAQFAEQLGIPCVSLLGSQLAPEDLIGVPRTPRW